MADASGTLSKQTSTEEPEALELNGSEFARELVQRFEAQERASLNPRDLAELFRYTFQAGPRRRALLHALHGYLLRRTLEHARANTRFYRRESYADDAPPAADGAPDPGIWPVIERSTVVEHFDELLAADVHYASVNHTSGSTGQSLHIHKSSEELRFLWAYFDQMIKASLTDGEPRPLILSLPNLYHGAAVPLPSPGRVFVSGVTDDTLIQDAVQVLERSYRIPGHEERISVISGLSFHIKFFTGYLLDQGRDPRDFGIRSMNIVGEYVSERSRRFLEDSWGALIFDRFTLTESAGGADRCLHCGLFHLDPHVIGEVVDPVGHRSVKEGVGLLALTQLYPFVQIQPLIRYLTGDLVRRIPSSCRETMTFEFLGKVENCLGRDHQGSREWLVFSRDLFEVINELPDIRLYDTFPNVRSVRDTSLASPPIFTQRLVPGDVDGGLIVELLFELRYAPHFFADRIDELRARISNALLNAETALAQRLADGTVRLDLRFVGPGALDDAHSIKV